MTFEVSQRAQKAIGKIIAYYAENEPPSRAIKVLDSFLETFQATANNPFIYPDDKRYKGKHEVRRGVIHRTYVFNYRVFKTKIVIITIYHGKRNMG